MQLRFEVIIEYPICDAGKDFSGYVEQFEVPEFVGCGWFGNFRGDQPFANPQMVRRGVLIVEELVPTLLEDRGKGFGTSVLTVCSENCLKKVRQKLEKS